jgi:phage terminase large subunit
MTALALATNDKIKTFDFSSPELYNPVYIPTFHVKHRFLHYFGSAGSGKSVFAGQKEIVLSFDGNRRKRKTIVARRFYNTIEHSVYSLLKDIISEWELDDCFHFLKSPYSITNKLTGVQFIFVGLDDVEKIKSVQGVDRGWVEEATEMRTQSELNQLSLRLRGFQHVQWTLTYNPVNSHHWLNKQIHEKLPPGHFIFKTTYRDNIRMLAKDSEYGPSIEALKETDPNYYRVYGLGLWGQNSEGLIYPTNTPVPEMPVAPQAYGLDIGWNHPCVLVATALVDEPGKDRRQLYWDERLYKTKLHSYDLVRELNDLQISKNIPIISDHSPDYIDDLKAAGYWVIEADKEKGSVLAGINTVKKFDLNITARSKNIFREVQNYSWKNKNGRWLDEASGQEAEAQEGVDHAMDGGPVRHAVPGQTDIERIRRTRGLGLNYGKERNGNGHHPRRKGLFRVQIGLVEQALAVVENNVRPLGFGSRRATARRAVPHEVQERAGRKVQGPAREQHFQKRIPRGDRKDGRHGFPQGP